MDPVTQAVAAYLEALPEQGDRHLLVALSGGVDSMVLLHVLAQLRPRLPLRLSALTVDHGLRPFAAELNATREWAKRLSVPHAVTPLSPGLAERAQRSGLSLAAAARQERYAALFAAAKRSHADAATAHHRDDQAETILLNLCRGSGLSGLAGMHGSSPGAVLHRPLLDVSRKALEAYAARHEVPVVEDPTNASPSYRRNRLRHEVLPVLNEVFPGVNGVLARASRVLADQAAALRSLAGSRLDRWLRTDAGGDLTVPVTVLGDGPVRRVLLHELVQRTGSPPPEARHVLALDALCRGAEGTREVALPGALVARREYGLLRLTRTVTGAVPFALEIVAPGDYETPAGWLQVRLGPAPAAGASFSDRTLWLAESRAFPLFWRSWQRGDRVTLADGGSKLVSDVLGEARLPRPRRGGYPVLVGADGSLLWVAGLRRAPGLLPEPGREACLVTWVPEFPASCDSE